MSTEKMREAMEWRRSGLTCNGGVWHRWKGKAWSGAAKAKLCTAKESKRLETACDGVAMIVSQWKSRAPV